MKKEKILTVCVITALIGCASVEVKAPKEPIKMDITMRVDVYQHVVKDIDEIESMVSGSSKPSAPSLMGVAHAADLDPAVEKAALRRKARLGEIYGALSKGTAGENNRGLLEARTGGSGVERLVRDENSDRMVIFNALAKKNGVAVEEIQKAYANRLQQDAPAGSPLEDPYGNWYKK